MNANDPPPPSLQVTPLQTKRPVRVLIVDDYEDNRSMLRMMLKRRGILVLEAGDGNEAIEVARREAPDLILMDLSMPVMDGFEATRRLKGLELTQRIPVLAVSAHCGDPVQCAGALQAGCVDCFEKPLDFEKMATYLTNL